jgi:hypothetical protein
LSQKNKQSAGISNEIYVFFDLKKSNDFECLKNWIYFIYQLEEKTSIYLKFFWKFQ